MKWWTRSQSIRAVSEMPMTFPVAEAVVPLCHRLAPEIARLFLLGLSRRRIAKALGVDDKTVAKALARSGPLP